jgi:hypothetical protein
MSHRYSRRALSALVGLALVACNGTTGDALITFPAFARGAEGASEAFAANGWQIQLTYAQMHIGALYVNEAPPGSTFDQPVCISTGVYAAQVPGGVEVDLLSTDPQPFTVEGNGSADVGLSWEVWLTTGDVNAADNTGPGLPNIVDLQGTATRPSDGAQFGWAATVTIDTSNRGLPVNDPGQPGLNPICKQRVVQIGGIDMPLFAGGQLVVTVDPRQWFNVPIDFSTLPSVASDACEIDQSSSYGSAQYCIPDTSDGSGLGATQGATLFTQIHSGAAYQLSFTKAP